MAHFSLTDLSNRSGEVVEAAFRGPVEITRRGKRKFVLLTAEEYDRLVNAADTRRAFHAAPLSARSGRGFLGRRRGARRQRGNRPALRRG